MVDSIAIVVARIIPIILIIALGNLIRVRSILSADTVDELRGLVVNIALPTVLFAAFLDMELEPEFVGLFVTMATICAVLLGLGYLARALRGSQFETLIRWLRSERVSGERAYKIVDRPIRYWIERVLVGELPPSWHRFLTDPAHACARAQEAVRFTIRFLRIPSFRAEFLCEQVRIGHDEGMLTEAEAAKIVTQIKDPYIQKYLRCLAVHMCTLPVTQVVMVLVGAAVAGYCSLYRGISWAESRR